MKCHNCGAELSDDVKKCLFCKTILFSDENKMFSNFNFQYTITSKEQVNLIRDAVKEKHHLLIHTA